MASLDGVITFSSNEYRKCTVDGKMAVFHRWCEHCDVVGTSPMVGGTPAGQIKRTLGIVEHMDGTVEEVSPGRIKFHDGRVKEVWESTASTTNKG